MIAILTATLALATLTQGGSAPLIYGGEEAAPGEFPWLVSIQGLAGSVYLHICGGTIINSTHLVTGAHCVIYQPLVSLRVVAGAQYINQSESSQQTKQIKKAFVHNNYVGGGGILHFDIALLEVASPFNITNRVSAIQMPPNKITSNGNCSIAGWGSTESGEFSNVLLKAKVPVVSKDVCKVVYPNDFRMDNQMCAGRLEGGTDICLGDTGGGLICEDTGYKYFAGIGSYGEYCGRPGKPSVFTEVSSFITWIQNPFENSTLTYL